MKKKIFKFLMAMMFMLLPSAGFAQGLLINSTGMTNWTPDPNEWNRRSGSNQNSNQNNNGFDRNANNPLAGGYQIDNTYVVDENGNRIYATDSYVPSSSSSSSSGKTCTACNGSGSCNACRGHKGLAVAGSTIKCKGCGGNGTCYICHGTGRR